MPDVLNGGGYDAGAAGGADYEIQDAGAGLDDGGRDGGEGSFAGADVVGW